MLNARRVDSKFFISGGWQDIERDTEWIKTENIRAILDLQYTPYDDTNTPEFLRNYLIDSDIEYQYIPMYDGIGNKDVPGIFTRGEIILKSWDSRFTNKKDRILVKCAAGISRSTSQYLNYVCMRDNIPFTQALANLRATENNLMYNLGYWDIWPASPDIEFVAHLSRKYPLVGSAFGEVVR